MEEIKKSIRKSVEVNQQYFYKEADKKLTNKLNNAIDEFEEEIRYGIRGVLHLEMETSVIRKNYVEPFERLMIDGLRKMLNEWFNDVYRYELSKVQQIKSIPTISNKIEREETIASITNGINQRTYNPDLAKINELRAAYIHQMDDFFEFYREISEYSYSKAEDMVGEVVSNTVARIKKAYEEVIKELGQKIKIEYQAIVRKYAIINKTDDKIITSELPKPKVKTDLSVKNFPKELWPNIKRILGFKGLELLIENDKFYAVDNKKGIKDEIVFDSEFNYFHLASNPSDHCWLDVAYKPKDGPATEPWDTFWSKDGSIIYSAERKRVTLSSKELNADYMVRLNNDNTITIIKKVNNVKVEAEQSALRAEIESIYPNFINQFEEIYGIKKEITFPEELIPNIKRILGFKGYEFLIEDGKYFAVDKNTGLRDEIIFGKQFNFFKLASALGEKYELNTNVINKGKNEESLMDACWMQKGSIVFNDANKTLHISSYSDDTKYVIGLNPNLTIRINKTINKVDVVDSPDLIEAEIEEMYPGIIEQFKTALGVQKTESLSQEEIAAEKREKLQDEIAELERQKSEIERLIAEKSKLLKSMGGEIPSEEFKQILAEQKINDMEFASQHLVVEQPGMKVGQ